MEKELIKSAREGNLEKVKEILALVTPAGEESRPLNVNQKDAEYGNTALHWACRMGHAEIAALLLDDERTNANIRAKLGMTALYLACQEGQTGVVRKLLADEGVDVNRPSDNGTTPLMVACGKNFLELARLLLRDERCAANAQNENGATAFFLACQEGFLPLVRALSEFPKVSPVLAKVDGSTPLYIAAVKNHPDVVRLLLQIHHVNPNQAREGGFTPLYGAAQEGHLAVVQELLQDERVDPNLGNSLNTTPLFVACYRGHLEMVQRLLQEDRVEVGKARADGITPLWKAAEAGHYNVVKWILGSGRSYDARAKCNKGHEVWSHTTAAERARQVEHNEIAEIIEESLRDPDRVKARLRRELQIDFAIVEQELSLPPLPISRVKPYRCLDPLDVTYLNLSRLGLRVLSDNLQKFQNLKSLKLSHNEISALPECIFTLPNLESLNLDHNNLGENAEEFTNLLLPHVGKMEITLRGNPIFEFMKKAIEKALSITIPPESTVFYKPVVFEKVTDLTLLNLSNCGIKDLSFSFSALVNLTSINLSSNPLSIEAFEVVANFVKASKDLTTLSLLHCDTSPASSLLTLQALVACVESDTYTCKLTKLEIDEVKLESHEGLFQIPTEVLVRGSRWTATFILALLRSPKASPRNSCKLVVLGDEQSGKTTLLDCLFPLDLELYFSEMFFGLFPSLCRVIFKGKFMTRYALEDEALSAPIEIIHLERGAWRMEATTDVTKFGIRLVQTVQPFRSFELSSQSPIARNKCLLRLERMTSHRPTDGFQVSHQTVTHPLVTEALGDDGILDLSVWDFSGHRERYNLLQSFVVLPRTVFLVAWDASQGDAGFEGLRYWLGSLAMRLALFKSAEGTKTQASKTQKTSPEKSINSDDDKSALPLPQNITHSVIVVGTHVDRGTAEWQADIAARRVKVQGLAQEVGLLEPVDYTEVSCETMAHLSVLQFALFSLPLTHSYIGEKVPKSCMVVDTAVKELRLFHTAFPIVDVNRVAYQATGVMAVDGDIVRQSLRLISSWGTCVYRDWLTTASDTVFLDPTFLSRDVIMPLYHAAEAGIIQAGVFMPRDFAKIWPSLAAKKNAGELCELLLRTLEHIEVLYRPHDENHLEDQLRSVIVPSLLPEDYPENLFVGPGTLDLTKVLWPQETPLGLVEVHHVITFSAFSRELISRVIVSLDREIPQRSLTFRTGTYFGWGKAGLLADFDSLPEPGQGRPKHPHHLSIKIRDKNRGNAKKILDAIIGRLRVLTSRYPGLTLCRVAPSPHDAGMLLDLTQCFEHLAQKPEEAFKCPSTGKDVDLRGFLMDSGMLLDPTERESFWWTWFRTERWSQLSEEVPYSRFLFTEAGKSRDDEVTDKLTDLVGDLSRVAFAYAVDNPKLAGEFEQFRKSLREKHLSKPEVYKADGWTKEKDFALRQDYLSHLDSLMKNENFTWNEPGMLGVVPMYRGCTEREAWQLCEKGLMTLPKESDFGQGWAFTSSLTSALTSAESVPGKGRVVMLALIIPGNVYPATEGPKDTNSLALRGAVQGYQSHYTCVHRTLQSPIKREFNEFTDANQLVVFQLTQALPMFVMYISHQALNK